MALRVARCDLHKHGFGKPSRSGRNFNFSDQAVKFTFDFTGTHKEAFSEARKICAEKYPLHSPRSVLLQGEDKQHFNW